MNIAKALIVFGILLVGQAHAMDDKDAENNKDTGLTTMAFSPDRMRLAIRSGDNTAIMDIQPEKPQGIIATGWYMWKHREYARPWISARRNYKHGKQKIAESKTVDPKQIDEIEACAPAEGFASYKTAIDARVRQFAQKHKLDEQDTTNLRRFTLSTYQTSLLFINNIQTFEGENVNNIKTLLERMRENNNE